MPFKKGHKKMGGIKKGTLKGRNKAIGQVDIVCAKAKNLRALKLAMQTEFDTDPLKFFRTYVMPLAPKQLNISNLLDSGYATKTPAQAAEQMDAATLGESNDE